MIIFKLWARIEPEPGVFSNAELDHYKLILAACLRLRINPVVTFNHWSCPLWFATSGGWNNPDAPKLFARYSSAAARHLAAQMRAACTLNETNGNQVIAWSPGKLRGERPQMARPGQNADGRDLS